ncbi:receptor-transporting protein 3-like [Ambystoma mexicanum]|uniref:receptor-transporting protein 3-like n=1 Tax=Ambystoma mexicanum TaxID=8296 RepID=UPI0037E86A6E
MALDETWDELFQEKVKELGRGDIWKLAPDNQLTQKGPPGWLTYTVHAFAKFSCSKCSRWWYSSQVLVLFHMRLEKP